MLFTYPNKELLVFFFFFLFFKNVALARNPQCPEHVFHHLEARARVGAQPRLEPKVKSSPSAPSLRYLFLYGLLTFSFVNVKCLLHTAFFLSMKEKHQFFGAQLSSQSNSYIHPEASKRTKLIEVMEFQLNYFKS